jgi:gp45 sliding clamp, C terminal
MKLSENTINILKNFASINPSLLVNPGNALTTMSVNKSIFAVANVEETFSNRFAIYEMSKFLGVISLFKDPEFIFGDKQVKLESGRQSVNYTYADPSMIVAPDPNKNINFPAADIEFSISHDELQRVVRATSVLQLPEIAVTGDGSNILVTATNSKNPTTDIFGIEVGNTDKVFTMYFDVDDIIKLISADYNVKITSKGLSMWRSDKVLYYVAMKANSSFGN